MEINDAMFEAARDHIENDTHDDNLWDALNSAFSAITLDEATRDRCAEAVEGLKFPPSFYSFPDAHEGWDRGCEDAINAIHALPVAPVRPLPTLEEVAKVLCCGEGGCSFEHEYLSECSFDGFTDRAADIIELFTGDAK